MCPRGSTAYVITRALLIPLYFLGAGHYNNCADNEGERRGVYFGSFFLSSLVHRPFGRRPATRIYVYLSTCTICVCVLYTCVSVRVYVCGVKASRWKSHLLCTAAAALVREQ